MDKVPYCSVIKPGLSSCEQRFPSFHSHLIVLVGSAVSANLQKSPNPRFHFHRFLAKNIFSLVVSDFDHAFPRVVNDERSHEMRIIPLASGALPGRALSTKHLAEFHGFCKPSQAKPQG